MTDVEVRRYQTAEGRVPLSEWLDGLRDGRARARIVARPVYWAIGKALVTVSTSYESTMAPVTACTTGKTATS